MSAYDTVIDFLETGPMLVSELAEYVGVTKGRIRQVVSQLRDENRIHILKAHSTHGIRLYICYLPGDEEKAKAR